MNDYRQSHSSEGYGECYSHTYIQGYYFHQWNLLERPILERSLGSLRDAGARSCLDFACGTGRITSVAENFFSPIVGVDVSKSMLEEAQKRVRSAALIQQDITKGRLDQSFDVCTAFRFFLNAQHELRCNALSAIREHLTENGVLVANIHVNSRSILGVAYRARNRIARRTVANTESFENFQSLLHEHGFSVEDVIWYSYLPRVGWWFSSAAKYALMPVEKAVSHLPFVPESVAQSFIVIARRQG